MREIKFRGKRIDNGEWVEGYFVKDPKDCCLIYLQPFQEASSNTYYFVIPESVGMFIGLLDSTGIELWDKDIICNKKYLDWEWRGVIKFSHGVFGAEWLSNIESQSMVGSWGQKHNLRRLDDDILENQIKIGNIIDNPELLIKPV